MTSELFGIHSNEKQADDMKKYLSNLNNEPYVNVENNQRKLGLESEVDMIDMLNKIYNEIIEIKVRLNGLDKKK